VQGRGLAEDQAPWGSRTGLVQAQPGEGQQGVQGGWPQILASLKSLLETGEPLAWG
jgi:hypothetical protein